MVAVVGGTRPRVSLPDVRQWIVDGFNIPSDSFAAQRYQPEDFLLKFSYYDDMLRVLHDPPLAPPFTLVLKRCRRQLLATAEDVRFKVHLAIRGIPVHAWNLPTVWQLLSPACSLVRQPAA